MKKYIHLASAVLALILAPVATGCTGGENADLNRARAMKKTIYSLYRVDDSPLLAENYPQQSGDRRHLPGRGCRPDRERILLPMALLGNAVDDGGALRRHGNERYLDQIKHITLEGLDRYYDTSREPYAYASYITAETADRFYDDNIWLAIDLTDLYLTTGDEEYLASARGIWDFILSGRDDVLGDGIYWCEQKKHSKNTCSNAPAAVCALKLYKATGEEEFLTTGRALYEWVYTTLRDAEDNLYFDNISLDGNISRAKYSYNSGQMIEAGALLYSITGEDSFLRQAQATAHACYDRWFKTLQDGNRQIRIMESGDVWFDAVMLRGLIASTHRRRGRLSYRRAPHARLRMAQRTRQRRPLRQIPLEAGREPAPLASDAGRLCRDVGTHGKGRH